MKNFLLAFTLVSQLGYCQLTWQWTKPLITNVNNSTTIQVESSAKDASGNLYYGGWLDGPYDFDPSASSVVLTPTTTSGNTYGSFISKYDANGNLLWAKAFGNGLEQHVKSIAVDPFGNVNLTGYYFGTADFDPSAIGTFTLRAGWYNTDEGCFVTRFDGAGAFLGAFSISSGNDYFHQAKSRGVAIMVDQTGVLNIIGSFSGTLDFELSPSLTHTLSSGGGSSMFLAKYFTSGNALSVFAFGGNGNSVPIDAKLNGNDDIYVTGWFNYTKGFYPGTSLMSFTSTPAGASNAFIAKYDKYLSLLWVKAIPGVGTDGSSVGVRITLDSNGDPWIAGHLYGTANYDDGFSNYNLNSGSYTNSFITKYDNAGNFSFANTFTGNSYRITAHALKFDSSNNMYFTGCTSGTIDLDLSTANTSTILCTGAFLIKNMLSSGLQCSNNIGPSAYFNGPVTEMGLEVNNSDIYVSQFVLANIFDFDPGPATYTVGSSTFRGVFLSKYSNGVATGKAGIENRNEGLHIFPNPTSDDFIIDSENETSIIITNILGETILTRKLQLGKNEINLNDQANGIYFIRANNSTFKILKQ